jgi:hypothetical protein
MTPAERSAAASVAGRASSEARKRRRAEAGIPEPTRAGDYLTRPVPGPAELGEWIAIALAADPTLSERALRRQAVILRHQYLARIAFEAVRNDQGDQK